MKQYSFGSLVRAGIWGALAGGTAGFCLGLLVAPEKGRTLRRRVAYRLEWAAGKVGDLIDEIAATEAESEARRTEEALVADAEQRAHQIRQDLDDLLGEMRRHSHQRQG